MFTSDRLRHVCRRSVSWCCPRLQTLSEVGMMVLFRPAGQEVEKECHMDSVLIAPAFEP